MTTPTGPDVIVPAETRWPAAGQPLTPSAGALAHALNKLSAEYETLRVDHARQASALATAEAALAKYGEHRPGCIGRDWPTQPFNPRRICTCGLDAALASSRAGTTGGAT